MILNSLEKIRAYFSAERFVCENGIVIEDAAAGYAKLRLNLTERHRGAFGPVSRSVLFTLADFAAAPAAQFGCAPGESVSFDVKISFAAPCAGPVLTAEAKRLRRCGHLDFYRVEIRDSAGGLSAVAAVTAFCQTGETI